MNNTTISVPCGNCPACRRRRAEAWAFRLEQEDKRSISSQFITLTYDTLHVPISHNGFMELEKRDLQLFFKRLRKAHEKLPGSRPKIKYYGVGEYGGRTNRPHYHILLFNAELNLIQPAWPKGQIHYGTVSGASVGYTLKYISKPPFRPMHRNDDRTPQFSLMSKGLGDNYINEKMIEWHHADLQNRMYCNIQDGKKISMPRYYKERIYHEAERKAVGAATRQRVEKQLKKDMDNDPLYFHHKAVTDQGRIDAFNRKNLILKQNEI